MGTSIQERHSKMKAAVYSPYLDTLGGGERYVLSFAKVLSDNGWSVDLQSSDNVITKKLEKRFGLHFKNIKTVEDIKRGDGYDLCFWLSDGSVPNLLARKNILHFQRPFFNVDGKNLINRMKFFRINRVVVNSVFTKKWIDKEYPVNSTILYPPVDVSKFKPGKKEKLIICIARFSQLEQSKRQDVLVSAFKKLYDLGNKDWKMVLAGGSEVGRTNYVDTLRRSGKGYPIRIIENPDFKVIKDLYAKAKIFWSASGYGVDEEKNPQKLEHFGITVVEAMSAGVLPVVYNAGGHKEIIEDSVNGFLWKTKGELIKKTRKIIEEDKFIKDIVKSAKSDSNIYSYESFEKKVLEIIKP